MTRRAEAHPVTLVLTDHPGEIVPQRRSFATGEGKGNAVKALLQNALAVARRHAEEGIGWAIALAAAAYAGVASGVWTPVAAVAVVAVAARWLLSVALRERHLRTEDRAARARRLAALRAVAEVAARLRKDLIACDGLVLRRQGLPALCADDVIAIERSTV